MLIQWFNFHFYRKFTLRIGEYVHVYHICIVEMKKRIRYSYRIYFWPLNRFNKMKLDLCYFNNICIMVDVFVSIEPLKRTLIQMKSNALNSLYIFVTNKLFSSSQRYMFNTKMSWTQSFFHSLDSYATWMVIFAHTYTDKKSKQIKKFSFSTFYCASINLKM